MTDAQRRLRELRERQSKERQRMAELSREAELTDETRAELDRIEAGTPDLERQLRAAVLAVEQRGRRSEGKPATRREPDAEHAGARRSFESKARLSNYLLAAARGTHRGRCRGGAVLRGLASRESRSNCGTCRHRRAAPRRSGQLPRSARHRGREPGSASARRCSPTASPPGSASKCRAWRAAPTRAPPITTSQTASALAKSGAAVGTAGAFTVTTATPKRVSGAARTGPRGHRRNRAVDNFESILRENLSLALSDALDSQAINGNGTAPNLAGILNRLTDPSTPAAGVADFDDFRGSVCRRH